MPSSPVWMMFSLLSPLSFTPMSVRLVVEEELRFMVIAGTYGSLDELLWVLYKRSQVVAVAPKYKKALYAGVAARAGQRGSKVNEFAAPGGKKLIILRRVSRGSCNTKDAVKGPQKGFAGGVTPNAPPAPAKLNSIHRKLVQFAAMKLLCDTWKFLRITSEERDREKSLRRPRKPARYARKK